jgi:hypothetical protein
VAASGYRLTYAASNRDDNGHYEGYTLTTVPSSPGSAAGNESYFADQTRISRAHRNGPASVSDPARASRQEFRILDHVGHARKVGRNYVTRCPSCADAGRDRAGDNLAISIGDPRKYICWAGCTKEMIRRALGHPIPTRRSA